MFAPTITIRLVKTAPNNAWHPTTLSWRVDRGPSVVRGFCFRFRMTHDFSVIFSPARWLLPTELAPSPRGSRRPALALHCLLPHPQSSPMTSKTRRIRPQARRHQLLGERLGNCSHVSRRLPAITMPPLARRAERPRRRRRPPKRPRTPLGLRPNRPSHLLPLRRGKRLQPVRGALTHRCKSSTSPAEPPWHTPPWTRTSTSLATM